MIISFAVLIVIVIAIDYYYKHDTNANTPHTITIHIQHILHNTKHKKKSQNISITINGIKEESETIGGGKESAVVSFTLPKKESKYGYSIAGNFKSSSGNIVINGSGQMYFHDSTTYYIQLNDAENNRGWSATLKELKAIK